MNNVQHVHDREITACCLVLALSCNSICPLRLYFTRVLFFVYSFLASKHACTHADTHRSAKTDIYVLVVAETSCFALVFRFTTELFTLYVL